MKAVTIVIPFRDRDLTRISNLVQSVRKHTQTQHEILIADFGSRKVYSDDLQKLAIKWQLTVVRTETEGLPWSRAKAINTGVRASRHEWICILDADMIFHNPLLDRAMEIITPADVWFSESFWPQSRKQSPLKGRVFRSRGVFSVLHKDWFLKLGGFDERMEFWGGEDSDWLRRLKSAGANERWFIAEEFQLTHTWHPAENTPFLRPAVAEWDTLSLEMENMLHPVRPGHWGLAVTLSERPILVCLPDFKPAETLYLEGRSLTEYLPKIVDLLNQGVLFAIDFGPRIEPRKLTRFQGFRTLLNRFIGPFSLRCDPIILPGLENFLIARKLLRPLIADMYLQSNLQGVYLLGVGPNKGAVV